MARKQWYTLDNAPIFDLCSVREQRFLVDLIAQDSPGALADHPIPELYALLRAIEHKKTLPNQTPPRPALRLCIIKPTGFLGLFRECNPCFAGHYRFFPSKKANLLNDALVERRSWRGLA
jgi:hypothetical protein